MESFLPKLLFSHLRLSLVLHLINIVSSCTIDPLPNNLNELDTHFSIVAFLLSSVV